MRARITLTLLLLATFARAQDDKPRTPLPVNAFQKAREGDWAVLSGSLGDRESGKKVEHHLRFRVQSGGGEDVTATVDLERSGAEPKSFLFGFGAKAGPTVEQTFSWLKLATVGGVKVTDEERKVGDRSFACQKLAFAGTTFSKQRLELTAWLSKEVRGCGIVALAVSGDVEGSFELAGFGAADKVEWGKSWDDLKGEREKAPKDEAGK